LKERTRGCDLFEAVCDAFDKSNLKWSKILKMFFATNKSLEKYAAIFFGIFTVYCTIGDMYCIRTF